MKKRILSLLLVLLMAMTLVPMSAGAEDASEAVDSGIYFDKSTGTVTGCDDNITELNIPEEIDGVKVTAIKQGAFGGEDAIALTSVTIPKTVTSIATLAFHNCDNLKSITVAEENPAYCSIDGVLFNKNADTLLVYPNAKAESYEIPEGVTCIGAYAFNFCRNLKSVVIPDGVITIEKGAFKTCMNLTGIVIPNSVTDIGSRAFYQCYKLESFEVAADNTAYCAIDGVLFNKNATHLLAYPNAKADTSYIVPDGVVYICEDYTFRDCDNLNSITIPSSVEYIVNNVFSYNRNLTSINVDEKNTKYSSVDGVLFYKGYGSFELEVYPCGKSDASYIVPDGVVGISQDAFAYNQSIRSITIPTSVMTIKNYAFDSCRNLTDVYYLGTEAQWNAISIGSGNDYLLSARIHFGVHEHVTELCNAIQPTCTEAGYTGDEVCMICNEVISQGETIPATGHHYDGKVCTDCGHKMSTGETIQIWFKDAFQNIKNFFDKIFGRH